MVTRKIQSLAAMFAFSLLQAIPMASTYGQDYPPKPTAEHQALAEDVGVWDAETKFWMQPDTDPITSKAVETNTMAGQLWLITEFKGNFAGMPFVGHGQFGYDPIAKKYIGTWVDSMAPYLYTMEGTFDEQTKTLTMMSTGRDPKTGKISTSKNITQYIDADTKTFEIHAPVPGQEGKWWKMMEISYKRRK